MSTERREREAARKAHRIAYQREERPIVAALRADGLRIRELNELTSGAADPYAAHIPILLEWLAKAEYVVIRETMARALTIREARDDAVVLALLEALRVAPPEEGEPTVAVGIPEMQRRADLIRLRQALGTAIAFTAGPEQFDTIVALIRDPAAGGARASLVEYLGRHKRLRDRSIPILRELLADEAGLGRDAVAVLGRLRATEARQDIERYLRHDQDWVRTDAKKALAKLPGK